MDFTNARYVLRLTWRWPWLPRPGLHRPDRRAIAGLAVLFRYLGFAVEMGCQGTDHASYRLRPKPGGDLPLGAALARIETWEQDALFDYPQTTWDVSVELPCPRQTVAFDAPVSPVSRLAALSEASAAHGLRVEGVCGEADAA